MKQHIKLYEEFILDESIVSTLAKYIPAIPTLMKLVGSATRVLGKNFNNDEIVKIGDYLTKNSDFLKTKFNSVISSVIKPYMKPGYDSEKVTNDLMNLLVIKYLGQNPNVNPIVLINTLSIPKIQQEAVKLLPEVLRIKNYVQL